MNQKSLSLAILLAVMFASTVFAQEEGGCEAALPFYQRLREEYSRTGWASVAESALTRCSEGRLDQP